MLDFIVRRRLHLYAAGWLLVLGSILFWGLLEWGSDRLWRYSLSDMLYLAGAVVILATALLAVGASFRYRRLSYLPGILVSGLFGLLVFAGDPLPRDAFANGICGQRSGCHFLTVAPVFTDTVYEVWHAPEPGVWAARRVDTRGFSYSEDGSYIAGARLKLSGNEQILVLARGGYLVDAIDLGTGEVLSLDIVGWNDPEREARMRENSARIQSLLDANV